MIKGKLLTNKEHTISKHNDDKWIRDLKQGNKWHECKVIDLRE